MNIRHLQYIVAIAEKKSISKAAETLYISQSSLSYYLATLEKEIGTPLFLRKKDGVEITEAGIKYISACYQIIEIHDQLYKELSTCSASKKIVVSTTSMWGSQAFAELIPKFQKHYPAASFQLTQSEFVSSSEIENGTTDFAFISLSPFDKIKKNIQILRKEYFYFAIASSDPYASVNTGTQISLAEIFEHFKNANFILSRVKSANYKTIHALFQEHGFTPANITEANGLMMTADIIANGGGITLMPESGKTSDPRIKFYTLDTPVFRYNTLISKPKSNFTDLEKAFYHFALNYFKYKYPDQ